MKLWKAWQIVNIFKLLETKHSCPQNYQRFSRATLQHLQFLGLLLLAQILNNLFAKVIYFRYSEKHMKRVPDRHKLLFFGLTSTTIIFRSILFHQKILVLQHYIMQISFFYFNSPFHLGHPALKVNNLPVASFRHKILFTENHMLIYNSTKLNKDKKPFLLKVKVAL